MESVEVGFLFLVLLGAVAALAIAARHIGIPYPILMVIGGLVLGLLPGVPRVELRPDVVLLVFLPTILFSAAFLSSPRDLWRNVRPITLLAFGLVLMTTVAVAAVMMALVPGIGWPAAAALGAIVSPPDAIAATSIAQRLGMPRRLVTILEGESLVNDATALVTYRLALAAAATGTFSLGEAAMSFVTVAVGGVLVGLVVALAASWVLKRLEDPPVEVLITLLAPFAAYLPAENLHVSGVLAAVTAGLVLGWRAPRIMGSDTRILGFGAWQMTIFVVNGLAFILIGLQLPSVLEGLAIYTALELAGLAAAVVATVILVRMAWVFPGTYLPRILVPGLSRRDPAPGPGVVLVLGWAGMRGVVSLAAALALPGILPNGDAFPRNLLIFLTFAVILATLVGQGLTLPWLIRRLRLGDDGSAEQEELHAREAATEAALQRLDELVTEVPGHLELIDRLRDQYRDRAQHFSRQQEGSGVEMDQEEIEHEQIRREVLGAERVAVVDLRNRGVISDEALRRVERDLDLDELRRAG
ncbi:MAG TPA: Na+/H+ antiporter [Candidatus Limnocylindria bacterium]